MLTMKEYAKKAGISYEAVRYKVKRYEVELSGHIHPQGKTQYLDDVAMEFLDGHRLDRHTDQKKDEYIQELEKLIKSLTDDLERYESKHATSQDIIITLQGQLVDTLCAMREVREQAHTDQLSAQHANNRADRLASSLRTAQNEIERLKARGWWQRLIRYGE